MPLLLLQGIWLKLTVLRLPEPCGERSGHCGDGSKLKLLIVGDSAAAGVGVEKQKNALSGQLTAILAAKYDVHWRLIANTGVTSSDLIKNLTALPIQEPTTNPTQEFDYILVSVGVNDVTHLTRSSHWFANIKTITELLDTKFDNPKVLLTSVPPMHQFMAIPYPLRWWFGLRAKKLNELMIKAVKNKKNYSILTFDLPFKPEFIAKDGFHPSKLAYGVWANQAAEKIDELID